MDFLKNIWVVSILSAAIGGIATYYATITMVISAPSVTIASPECSAAKVDLETTERKPLLQDGRIRNSKDAGF